MAIGLVLVSALSALAFLALSAYAPDLRSNSSSGATVVSKSAIGFAGLKLLLESTAVDTAIGREPPRTDQFSLVILTPEVYTDPKDLASLATTSPRLIVLPKWAATPDLLHDGWVTKSDSFDAETVAKPLSLLAKGVKLEQHKGVLRTALTSQEAVFALRPAAGPVAIDQLQTIAGPNLDPDIVDGEGKAVLVHLRGTQTYILSEPDLLNSAGLNDLNTARIGVVLVTGLRVGAAPVVFDVTLNGFRRSPDLLRTVFSPPFLGATLCTLLAAAFLAFHAMSRFGSPQRGARIFAFGKRALADNTAAVIRMMGREPAMAPRYAQAALTQVAAFFGLTREQAADPAILRTLEQRGDVSDHFGTLHAAANDARDAQDLMQVARKLYRWRRGITHGHL
jgi:hypothetical protein